MDEPLLLIETSGRGGRVGLAVGGTLRERALDPARRHARDLAPAVADLLAEVGLNPRDVRRVGVSVGPGSFTGLRVGIMSAKTFAYATGCELVAVPTFAALAAEVIDPTVEWVCVVADALQGHVYAERFRRTPATWDTEAPLQIMTIRAWETEYGGWLISDNTVIGPGVPLVESSLLPEVTRTAIPAPGLQAMLTVARRLTPLSRDEQLALEPLYLRGSSAEEKAARDGRP